MWSLTFAFVVVLICLWLRWRKNQFRLLKDLGIPGPEPNIFFGNYLDIMRKNPLKCRQEWKEKYGKIYGYYFGAIPMVVISDVNLIKKVQIGEFHKFINRPTMLNVLRNIGEPGDGFYSQISILRDRRWKEIRSTLTPSFTTSKMKMMVPIINSTIDSLVDIVDDKVEEGGPFDIYPLYQGLTMDIIGRAAFGVQTECQKNPEDPFLKSTKVLLAVDASSLILLVFFCFPEFAFIIEFYLMVLIKLSFLIKNPMRGLTDSVKQVIQARRKDIGKRRHDLLQLLIDSEMKDSTDSNMEDLTAGDDAVQEMQNIEDRTGVKTQRRPKHMTDGEITDNAVLFFLAGFETTSTVMGFTTHLLVHFPEVQDRVRSEVESAISHEGKLDYGSVQQLQYLDQVVNEALRLYPPIVFFVNREAGEDIDLDGLRIKKGMNVEVPVYSLQHDEEFWPDSEMFDPDRFSPSNKHKNEPMAFQAFGAGPRNCIGLRFAQMSTKLALARLIYKYKFSKCEKTDTHPINLKVKFANIVPANGVYIKAEPIER